MYSIFIVVVSSSVCSGVFVLFIVWFMVVVNYSRKNVGVVSSSMCV